MDERQACQEFLIDLQVMTAASDLAETETMPHVVLTIDPLVPRSLTAAGPYPDVQTALEQAEKASAILNEGNTDVQFKCIAVPLFPPRDL